MDRYAKLSVLLVGVIAAIVLLLSMSAMATWPENKVPESSVSTNNSTASTLAGDAVFTGAADEISGYSGITCFSFSDVASAANGFTMQLSTNGTNWDRVKSITTVAGVSSVHTLQVVTKYFRVVYTNGAAAQASFRLQCMYYPYGIKHLSSSATQTTTAQVDVELVRVISNHGLDVARGIVTGHSLIRVTGRNGAVGNSEETIWESGGDYTGFLTAAAGLEILSDDADDTSAGTGARTVIIKGLDSSFAEQTETMTMNGTSTVATSETDWMRVNHVAVVTNGTYSTTDPSTTGSNEGTITVRVVSGGVIMSTIDPQEGHSESSVYTVPLGVTAFLRSNSVTVVTAANKEVDLAMWARRDADDVSAPFTPKLLIQRYDDFSGRVAESFVFTEVFPEMTDIWFSGIRSGSGDAIVNIIYEMHLVPNAALPPVP